MPSFHEPAECVSLLAAISDKCPTHLQISENKTGWVEWKGTELYIYCWWWIQLLPTLGAVVQFDNDLQLGDHPNTDDMIRVHHDALSRTYFRWRSGRTCRDNRKVFVV
ncbi:hypothetical protein BaRGS_00013543 [Batillaria attramentaria]|uniref:Uncharacterized protein n=1 Tax=Batillaria attramentaria TaxID=370345 RepID=A0ABD0L745_9CAEN